MGKYDDFTVPTGASKPTGGKYSEFNVPEAPPREDTTPYGMDRNDPFWQKALRSLHSTAQTAADVVTFGGSSNLNAALSGNPEQYRRDRADVENAYPMSGVAGEIGGLASFGGAISAGLRRAAPGLFGGNGLASTFGREATAAMGADAVNSVGNKGEAPDPTSLAISGGLGGGASILGSLSSRVLSPSARFRSYGSDLTPEDIEAAIDMGRMSQNVGIPLNGAEAVAAVAPGRAAGILDNFDTAAQSRGGSRIARNAEDARRTGIEDAGRRVKNAVSVTGANPVDTSREAGRAIQNQRDIVQNSAQPYYDVADPSTLPRRATNPSAAEREAARNVVDDEVVMERIMRLTGTDNPNTVAFRDAQVKEMRHLADRAEATNRNGLAREAFGEGAADLEDFIARNVPDYATGRQISTDGRMSVERLERGPLGVIEANPGSTRAQGDALFGVTNATDARIAEDAARRLGPRSVRGILANRIDDSISVSPENPRGFAAAIPTGHSASVVQGALGTLGPIEDTIRVGRAVRPTPPNTFTGDNVGPVSEAYRRLREYGRADVMKLFQDPDNLEMLGTVGPGERFVHALSTGAGARVGEGTTKKRRKRD